LILIAWISKARVPLNHPVELCLIRWWAAVTQCRRYAMEAHQSSAARSHLSLVCGLAVDQQRQIDELSSRLAAVTTALAGPDGSFLWRITGFKSKAGLEVSTQPFILSGSINE